MTGFPKSSRRSPPVSPGETELPGNRIRRNLLTTSESRIRRGPRDPRRLSGSRGPSKFIQRAENFSVKLPCQSSGVPSCPDTVWVNGNLGNLGTRAQFLGGKSGDRAHFLGVACTRKEIWEIWGEIWRKSGDRGIFLVLAIDSQREGRLSFSVSFNCFLTFSSGRRVMLVGSQVKCFDR